MLYKISDNDFLIYCRRVSTIVHTISIARELLKLKHSVELLQRQATNTLRTSALLSLLHDMNHKLNCLGEHYANPTRLP